MVMDARDLILLADRLAAGLLLDAKEAGISHKEMLMAVLIAKELMKATYPGELFPVLQEAEATLDLFVRPAGDVS